MGYSVGEKTWRVTEKPIETNPENTLGNRKKKSNTNVNFLAYYPLLKQIE